jgi:endonuclease YncB( thermonuclease family)
MIGVLLCLVVGITDGDTLSVRCESHEGQRTVTVRLSQIDAPEKRQPWGEQSRQNLAAQCFQKPARILSLTVLEV